MQRPVWWKSFALPMAMVLVVGVWLIWTSGGLRQAWSRISAAITLPANSAAQATDAVEAESPVQAETVWSERLEVFYEHPFAVRDQPVRLHTHVSVLESGLPITRGTVHLEVHTPAGITNKTEPTTAVAPGVFNVDYTPAEAGPHRAVLRVESPQIEPGSASVELAVLEVYDDRAAADAAAADANDPTAESITFLKEQQWRIGLLTSPAAKADLVERLEIPAQIVIPPGQGAVITSPVAGKLQYPPGRAFPAIGTTVSAGDLLAIVLPTVAPPAAFQMVADEAALEAVQAELAVKRLDLESRIRSAELELEYAQQTYRRLAEVSGDGAVAGRELLRSHSEMNIAEASLAGLRRLLAPYQNAQQQITESIKRLQSERSSPEHGLGIELRSPIDGRIAQADMTAGELVDPTHVLFRVIDPSRVWVLAEVSEFDIDGIVEAADALLEAPSLGGRDISVLAEGGRLVHVGEEVDPQSRTVAVRYEVPNRDGRLRAGMYVDLLAAKQSRRGVLAVPREAVIDDGSERIVYVQQGGETFIRQPVVTGIRDATQVEIRSGLEAGQRVVLRGAFAVRLAGMSSSVPEHHHHQ